MSVIPQASKAYTGFTPTSIPGCSLWLDAADPNGNGVTPSNGTSISTWVDKSGNSRNAVNQTTSAILYTNVKNNLPVLRFVGSSQYNIGYSSFPNTAYTIFSVQLLSTATAWSVMLMGGDAGTTGRIYIGVGSDGSNVITIAGASNTWNDYNTNSPSYSNYNTWRMVSMVVSGSTLSPFVDGNAQTSKNGTTDSLSKLTIGANYTNTQNWSGDVAEILIFNSALTTAQRQQIEGYLANKWLLTGNIPATHPFKLTPLYTQPFSPLDIPGCQVWLDAADNNTLALSGSTLAGWIDKSGTGKAITINSAPTYSATGFNSKYPCFTFTTSNYLTTPITAIGTGDVMFVYVGKITNPGQNSVPLSAGSAASGGEMGLGWNVVSQYYNLYQYGSGEGSSANNIGGNVNLIQIGTRLSSTMSTFINGASPNASGTSSVNNTQTTFYIGNTGSFSFAGQLCEVLLYVGTTTTAQRQQLESYLAKKWGLQGSLVSTHPFKLYPPLTPVFNPLQISGCQLWLDAADRSTLTLNGSAVTQWNDKSGAGNHATAGVSPTYSNNAVVFDGSTQYLACPYSSSLQNETLFIVSYLNSANYNNYRNLVSSSGTGGRLLYLNIDGAFGVIALGLYNGPTTGANTSPAFQNVLHTYTSTSGASNTINLYINGSNLASGSLGGVYTSGLTSGIGGKPAGGNLWQGNLLEIIGYPSVLTTSQRQQVEAYLAQKWRLRTLPSTHPYKMFSTPFAPSQISGLSLWLDASDSASLTLSGSNVTTWTDKSAGIQAQFLTNAMATARSGASPASGVGSLGATNYPVTGYTANGNNILYFNQAILQAITTQNVNTRTYFLVIKIPSPASAGAILWPATWGVDGYARGGSVGFNSSTQIYFASQNVANLLLLNYSADTLFIMSMTFNSGTPNMWNTGGGTTTTTGQSAGSLSSLSDNYLWIGGVYGFYAPPYYIGEIIAYNTSLSTSQRQQVEGYLAWKWGLTASLPSGHPYKSIKP